MNSDNESTYTELVVNGVPFKTWEAEQFLGWEDRRAISFGKAETFRRARERARHVRRKSEKEAAGNEERNHA